MYKLFKIPDQNRSKTSDVIASLIQSIPNQDITLRALVDRLADRTFGLLLILISIFNILPFFSILGGLLIISIGIQMSVGRKTVWIPRFILDKTLPADKVRSVMRSFEPKVRYFEQYIRPRMLASEAPIVDRINGLVIASLGIIISLPIPLTNILPSLVVMIMGLALAERDGVLQIVSAILGISAMALFTIALK